MLRGSVRGDGLVRRRGAADVALDTVLDRPSDCRTVSAKVFGVGHILSLPSTASE